MGIFILIRCNACEIALIRDGDMFLTVDAAWEAAEAEGWQSAPLAGIADGATLCPKCKGDFTAFLNQKLSDARLAGTAMTVGDVKRGKEWLDQARHCNGPDDCTILGTCAACIGTKPAQLSDTHQSET